ncbi:FhuE receptor precursor [Lacunisphaera limnophila]|uniref:FhuE receptor n=1 Tax=Lacunisphaera limnophila TaxID=1838286 RepID=A0A1D8AUU4_9BACT|nr:TonB-dependent siderophore receptor [Lacunisphaera limnophila]AOS44664.1 FhuE receptor precursor [Lacunisphaera limnophila]
MNQTIRFDALQDVQAILPSPELPARAPGAAASPASSLGLLARAPGAFAPAMSPAASSLARPCHATATRMSWLGKLRQRRWLARTGPRLGSLVLTAASTLAAQTATPPTADTLILDKVVVTARREHRTSKGATNLPLSLKDTPQSISLIDQDALRDFATTGTNDALRLGTGLTVDAWETNRTSYSSRGFDIMLTQVDGLGMTNDWGLVVGQEDTTLFDRIELIRGANGLLTGVGNASGTINYVRKRPKNHDGGELVVRTGSHDLRRAALDYNQVLTASGSWAARVVVAHEDKDSYLRALQDRRTTLYGVVEGQIGSAGALTAGFTFTDSLQRSPMWGSLTLMRADGTQAAFDAAASPSQDWTRWALRSANAFIEYAHTLSPDWEAKLTYNHRTGDEAVKLFYAYSLTGTLNADHTGLLGWPYRSDSESRSDIVDASLTGHFHAFGRRHEVISGLSLSQQKTYSEFYSILSSPGAVLPAFPYAGDVYAEPVWGATSVGNDGDQKLVRFYAATRLALTDRLKAIAGLNTINLKRDGTSIYGGGVNLDNETTEKVSPYAGLTYDLTDNLLAYASTSDIFQAQDQRDLNGRFLAPMKGVNAEIGLKAEWLQRRLLTTVAVFDARQKGLATEAGFDPVAQQSYYEPKDVKSRGFEFEATGRVGAHTTLTAGFTRMELTGPDGNDIYEWIPRTIVNLRADTRLPGLPKLKLGTGLRWQSDIFKTGAVRQDSYLLVNSFAAYELTNAATVRLNVDNLSDEKYLRTVQFGAIYGAPRQFSLALDYKL